MDDFLRAAADRADGAGLPECITCEFREVLICGVLAHGVACERCARGRMVPCKGRGLYPSCGGRRRTESAALYGRDREPTPCPGATPGLARASRSVSLLGQ